MLRLKAFFLLINAADDELVAAMKMMMMEPVKFLTSSTQTGSELVTGEPQMR